MAVLAMSDTEIYRFDTLMRLERGELWPARAWDLSVVSHALFEPHVLSGAEAQHFPKRARLSWVNPSARQKLLF